MSAQLLTLLYDEMPRDLSPDEVVFCLFSASAAEVAVQAQAAKTWAQFAKAVALPFEQLVDTGGAPMPRPNAHLQ